MIKSFHIWLLLLAFCLAGCTASRYVSIRPEIEPEFLDLSYDEVVAVMERQPDSTMANEKGRTLVYNAQDYLEDRFESPHMRSASDMYIRVLLDEFDVCYAVETNIIRKTTRYDKKRTKEGALSVLGSVLTMMKSRKGY